MEVGDAGVVNVLSIQYYWIFPVFLNASYTTWQIPDEKGADYQLLFDVDEWSRFMAVN